MNREVVEVVANLLVWQVIIELSLNAIGDPVPTTAVVRTGSFLLSELDLRSRFEAL